MLRLKPRHDDDDSSSLHSKTLAAAAEKEFGEVTVKPGEHPALDHVRG